MRVAVSADDSQGLESPVSPHFGRCPYYILIDLDDRNVKQVRAIENPFYGQHQPGQVPAFVHQQGVDVMLTGGMGQRAIAFFQQYGIQAVTGAMGSVRHALESYLGGDLSGAAPCHESMEHAHSEGEGHSEYEKDEAGRLREELAMLRRQIDDITARLKHLDE